MKDVVDTILKIYKLDSMSSIYTTNRLDEKCYASWMLLVGKLFISDKKLIFVSRINIIHLRY